MTELASLLAKDKQETHTSLVAFRLIRVTLKLFLASHSLIVFILPYFKVFPVIWDFPHLDVLIYTFIVAALKLTISAIWDRPKFGSAGAILYAVCILYVANVQDSWLVRVLYWTFGLLAIVTSGGLWVLAKDAKTD